MRIRRNFPLGAQQSKDDTGCDLSKRAPTYTNCGGLEALRQLAQHTTHISWGRRRVASHRTRCFRVSYSRQNCLHFEVCRKPSLPCYYSPPKSRQRKVADAHRVRYDIKRFLFFNVVLQYILTFILKCAVKPRVLNQLHHCR